MGFIRGVTMSVTLGRTGRLNTFWLEVQKRKLVAIALFFGILAAPGTLLGSDGSDQPVDEPYLSNLVVQDCGSCHGLTLRGGLGPPLRPENLDHLPVDAIAAIIREGVPGSAMPPWKPLLAPEEIHWISRQLKSGALISP
jgi:cytochrome c55X